MHFFAALLSLLWVKSIGTASGGGRGLDLDCGGEGEGGDAGAGREVLGAAERLALASDAFEGGGGEGEEGVRVFAMPRSDFAGAGEGLSGLAWRGCYDGI